MTKTKKIAVVLITIVAIMATFVISASARYSSVGVQVPSVSFNIIRDDDLANVRIARVMTEPALLDSDIVGYQSQYSGNVNESVRSQWRYDSVGDELELYFASNNSNYDAVIYFGSLPAFYNGARQQLLFYPMVGYSVSNDFVIDAHEIDYDVFGDSLYYEIRGYTVTSTEDRTLYKWVRYDDIVGWDLLSVLTDEEAEHSVISYVGIYYNYLNDESIQGSSTLNRFIIPDGNSFAKREAENHGPFGIRDYNNRVIGDGLIASNQYQYEMGYDSGYDVGFTEGTENGYDSGYDEGYHIGFENGEVYGVDHAIEERGLFAFIIDSIEAFFSYPLFDLPNGGQISLGSLLGVVVGALVFVWILKLIAGG